MSVSRTPSETLSLPILPLTTGYVKIILINRFDTCRSPISLAGWELILCPEGTEPDLLSDRMVQSPSAVLGAPAQVSVETRHVAL